MFQSVGVELRSFVDKCRMLAASGLFWAASKLTPNTPAGLMINLAYRDYLANCCVLGIEKLTGARIAADQCVESARNK